MKTIATDSSPHPPLLDERLRAEFLAGSYLVSACEQALEKMKRLSDDASGRTDVPAAALAIMSQVHADWRQTLRGIGRAMAAASSSSCFPDTA